MKHVVILGGGIAGMYAALKCIKLGWKVTLIEKKERLGGNIHTIYKEGMPPLEAGAGRFNEGHRLLIHLIHYYGLTLTQLPTEKDFFPVLECKTPIVKVNEPFLLQKVTEYSKNISNALLKEINFSQLCEMALGYKKTRLLIEAFGYNAEFLVENAYTALKTFQEDFTNKYPYYVCKEGLTELVSRMEHDLVKNGVAIHKETTIDKIKDTDNGFKLKAKSKSKEFLADYLFLALPKKALTDIPIFNDYTKTLLDTIVPVSLHRIYGQFAKPWFKDLPKFTTDLQIRQFIPIDPLNGIAMVSYSDLFDADYWKIYSDKGSTVLQEQLRKQLQEIFPSKKIPELVWTESYYWKEGVHVWIPNVDPEKIRKELANIHPRISIVGESYSMRQGWVEGALETVEEALHKLKKNASPTPTHTHTPSISGGATQSYKKEFKNKPSITKAELQAFKIHYPEVKWVLLQLPGEEHIRLIDVTEWIYQHPGGAQPFINHMYADISTYFKKISSHFEEKKIKDHVYKMVNKYTLTHLNV